MTPILEDLPFASGDEVLAFVNGMGGTPLIELYIVYNELAKIAPGARAHDRAQPDRQLHHLAGDAGLLDHAAQARRRDASALGRAGQHPRPCAGACSGRRRGDRLATTRSTWMQPVRGRDGRARQELDAARHGDRRRRPRDEHGPRHAARRSRSSTASERPTPAPCSRPSRWRLCRGRRGRGPAVRDAVPADGQRRWPARPSSTWPAGPRPGAAASRASRPAARPSPGTRR